MLVLNRNPGHAILIDGGIRIIILGCDKRGVRIGIEAPAHVGILREEIATEMAEANRQATTPVASPSWLQRVEAVVEALTPGPDPVA